MTTRYSVAMEAASQVLGDVIDISTVTTDLMRMTAVPQTI